MIFKLWQACNTILGKYTRKTVLNSVFMWKVPRGLDYTRALYRTI